jgi:hypothetical protein
MRCCQVLLSLRATRRNTFKTQMVACKMYTETAEVLMWCLVVHRNEARKSIGSILNGNCGDLEIWIRMANRASINRALRQ